MTAFDTILDALEQAGLKTHGSAPKARAQCPVHQSHGLTLSLRQLNDRATLKCFAGCETPDVLEAIGLHLRDLYDEVGSGHRGSTYVPRRMTPWEESCASIGLHNPPPIEHLLHRMMVEQAKEAAAGGGAA